ncbi:hypothetical protein [Bradyrhizobium vignae]|uniref:Uncharacterized protein n=1 Tax=Bradyrhizobium vignae TaxID=1549949 RepID=A0A2U3Q6F0_9BRAD|nr:hypothetical protein [Bradyrhizobium vignae]SPP96970.1 protein of unknown function [Bradyrhizobium vignae]
MLEALTELDAVAWSGVELSRFENDLDALIIPYGLLWQAKASKHLRGLDRGAHQNPTI